MSIYILAYHDPSDSHTRTRSSIRQLSTKKSITRSYHQHHHCPSCPRVETGLKTRLTEVSGLQKIRVRAAQASIQKVWQKGRRQNGSSGQVATSDTRHSFAARSHQLCRQQVAERRSTRALAVPAGEVARRLTARIVAQSVSAEMPEMVGPGCGHAIWRTRRSREEL